MNSTDKLPPSLSKATEFLISIANINSYFENPVGQNQVAELIAERLNSFGMHCTVEHLSSGHPFLTATTAAMNTMRRSEAILLSCHLDTVYRPSDDFRACFFNGTDWLHGPGVIDMKGGIATALVALEMLEKQGQLKSMPLGLCCTPDEEQATHVCHQSLREFAGKFAKALVFEPRRPGQQIVVSRLGYYPFNICARGRSAHAGTNPENGRDALFALTQFVDGLRVFSSAQLETRFNVGTLSGGQGRNRVPDVAQAELEYRFSDLHALGEFQACMRELKSRTEKRCEVTLDIQSFDCDPPLCASEDSLALAQRYDTYLGCGVRSDVSAGISDGNYLASFGLQVIDGLGPVGEGAHSPEERLFLPSLVEAAEALEKFLKAEFIK
jgi:glutamate carboxypeptidase